MIERPRYGAETQPETSLQSRPRLLANPRVGTLRTTSSIYQSPKSQQLQGVSLALFVYTRPIKPAAVVENPDHRSGNSVRDLALARRLES